MNSKLNKNKKEALGFVNSNNNINPMKYNSSSKKSQQNDMKFNGLKKDKHLLKYEEPNIKIKFERMISELTPDSSKYVNNFNGLSFSKKDFSNTTNDKKKTVFFKKLNTDLGY